MDDLEIHVRRDRERGCGWRKPGGTYLVSGGLGEPCGKLPLALERCPTCSHGIKFTRGWTWIDGDALLSAKDCKTNNDSCLSCPGLTPNPKLKKAGLLWIGEQFYKTPGDWIREAHSQGISRRISAVPNDFVVGETWVFVAHLKAIAEVCTMPDTRKCDICKGSCWHYTPAVFQIFCPQAIEYVVKDDDTEEELRRKVERGITLVRIERVESQPELITESVQ